MQKPERFMQIALEEADAAALIDEVPIGAVVVRNNQIVGTGHNLRELSQNATDHAEMIAIQEACQTLHSWRLEDCDLYVTVEPCVMCAGAIVNARIRHLYYGAPDYKAGAVSSLYHILSDTRLNHQVEVTGGVCQRLAADKMRRFFRRARRIEKLKKKNR